MPWLFRSVCNIVNRTTLFLGTAFLVILSGQVGRASAQSGTTVTPDEFPKMSHAVRATSVSLADSGLSIVLPHTPVFGNPKHVQMLLNNRNYAIDCTQMSIKEDPLVFPSLFPFTVQGMIWKFETSVGDDPAEVSAFANLYAQNVPQMVHGRDRPDRTVSIKGGALEYHDHLIHLTEFPNTYFYDGLVVEDTVLRGIEENLVNREDVIVVGKGKFIVALVFTQSFQWGPPPSLATALSDLKAKDGFESYLIFMSVNSLQISKPKTPKTAPPMHSALKHAAPTHTVWKRLAPKHTVAKRTIPKQPSTELPASKWTVPMHTVSKSQAAKHVKKPVNDNPSRSLTRV